MASVDKEAAFKEDDSSEFTWEVKANDRYYHLQFKEQAFPRCQRSKYKTNVIRTAKYNLFTFLPLNLCEQFHRMSNLYFLIIIILQGIPEISTLPWFTLFAPLVCLLVIRAARDLVDDIGRHRSDTAINNRPCQILVGRSFFWRKWKDLCVGDVVCLHKDNIVPADMLLLASTEPSSLCYVETADIDGETNLKFRQALAITHHELNNIKKMATFQGKVVCEKPNSRMHTFVGRLEWKGRKYPLDTENILLRGCKIRNTQTCYGLVIYAGFDTKIMMNSGKVHLKRTKLDKLMNKLVMLIFLFMVLVSLALTMGFKYKVKDFKSHHYYLPDSYGSTKTVESVFNFLGFLILLSVMVPMAMFILSEFIYLGNSVFINWDAKMYYEPLDMPAKARSTSLNDHLGQVEYIFSDKTGTLTQNVMTFKKCCIKGRIYGPDTKETDYEEDPYLWNEYSDGKLLFHNQELQDTVRANQDPMVREFWRLLALCHTVMVQEQDNQLLYQAASPDEEALVSAARNFGYVFLSRTQDTITLMELGQVRVYQVLAMMDFNSIRKRMSVLVRNPEGTILLYTKGADTVIFERLSERGELEAATEEALAAFAEQTLRTLCLAYKEVDPDVYEAWNQRHQEASVLLQNRAQALHQVYEEMEQHLQLLGATAIEDRLQDDVPDTIKCLKQGNIKVWVLTGDKQETAVNIGFACQLLSGDMVILEEQDIVHMLDNCWDSNNNLQSGKSWALPHSKMAMVISGDFLDRLIIQPDLDKNQDMSFTGDLDHGDIWKEAGQRQSARQTQRLSGMWRSFLEWLGNTWVLRRCHKPQLQESPEVRRERAFVDLAVRCQAVICCRVTPKQKALIVKLVKRHRHVVTLAIGDGANDVNMIKTADVGVGLAGPEGMQAVQSSDYVLAQFSFLRRLLLVHGRWSYLRVCKFLRYFLYKTLASMMAQIWFAFYNGFTAQPVYEGWFLALFNLLYSTLPVLYIGLFEQDVSAEKSLQMPQLYMAGQKDELFNYGVFFQALFHGTITSLVNFFMTLLACNNIGGAPNLSDYQSFAVILALSSLLSITLQVILIIKYWTILTVLAIFLSLFAYAVVTYTTQSLWLYRISPHTYPFLYADYNVLPQPFALLVVLLNVTTNTMFFLAFQFIYEAVTKPYAKVEIPSEEILVEPISYLQREGRGRRSSYAFSHHEGYANLITQGTSLRKSQDTNSELMLEEQSVYENEIPLNRKDPAWVYKRVSFLTKWKHQSLEKGASSYTASLPARSSLFTLERQHPSILENQWKSLISIKSSSQNKSPSPEQESPSQDESPAPEQVRSPLPGQETSSKDGSSTPERKPPSQDGSPAPGQEPPSQDGSPTPGQESFPQDKSPAPEQEPSSSQETLPLPEESHLSTSVNQPQILEGQPLPPDGPASSENQSVSPEDGLSFWKFWKFSWPYMWERKFQETEPGPTEVPMSLAETPPPPTEESDLAEQPMEVDPLPLESQSSSMEWLPVTLEDQFHPALAEQTSFPPEKQ